MGGGWWKYYVNVIDLYFLYYIENLFSDIEEDKDLIGDEVIVISKDVIVGFFWMGFLFRI